MGIKSRLALMTICRHVPVDWPPSILLVDLRPCVALLVELLPPRLKHTHLNNP